MDEGEKSKFTTDEMLGTLGYEVLGPSARKLGPWLAENVPDFSEWMRHKTRELFEKVGVKLTSRGVNETKPLPPGATMLAVQAATVEDSDEITEMLASLIANALDPDTELTLSKEIVQTLKEMSPQEALFLKVVVYVKGSFWELDEYTDGPGAFKARVVDPEFRRWASYSGLEKRVAAEAAVRHGLVKIVPRVANRPVCLNAISAPLEDGRMAKLVQVEDVEALVAQMSRILDAAPKFSSRMDAAYISPQGDPVIMPDAEEFSYSLTTYGINLLEACKS